MKLLFELFDFIMNIRTVVNTLRFTTKLVRKLKGRNCCPNIYRSVVVVIVW